MTARRHTYDEVGVTAEGASGVPGFWTVDVSAQIGHGREVFESARCRVLTWEMHRRSGLDVEASAVEPGQEVVLHLRLGPIRLSAPCRVVYVIDEPDRAGFAYGTLPGHPESGEEAFAVSIDASGAVTAQISGFSRPASIVGRLDAAAGHLVQRCILRRYLAALRPDPV